MSTRRRLFRLSILHKLLLGTLIFCVPMALMLALTIRRMERDISLARRELIGFDVIDRVLPALDAVVQYGRVLTWRAEAPMDDGQTKRARESADRAMSALAASSSAFDRLEDPDDKLAHDEAALRPSAILQRWNELSRVEGAQSSSLIPQYLALIADLVEVAQQVGDRSSLVLDPDLGRYYLADALCQTLPRAQARLGQILDELPVALRTSGPTSPDLLALIEHMKTSDTRRLSAQISKALRTANHANVPAFLEKYLHSTSVLASLVVGRDRAQAAASGDVLEAGRDALRAMGELSSALRQELRTRLTINVVDLERMRVLTLGIAVASLLASAGLVLLMFRRIAMELRSATLVARAMADGDLVEASTLLQEAAARGWIDDSSETDSRDESLSLMRAVRSMTSSLHALLHQMQSSGIQVSATTIQIAATAHQLEATVAEQAASTIQVAATSREISATSRALSQSMDELTGQVEKAVRVASAGKQRISEIQPTLERVLEATQVMAEHLDAISKKALAISEVVVAITKVAHQSNMLSLNAAIEAEKAGEAGRGFSVVAREIRRLADQTSVSALEISEQVGGMQTAVLEGEQAMRHFSELVTESSENIAGIGKDLAQVILSTEGQGALFEGMNLRMRSQSDAADQISTTMGQLGQAVTQTKGSLRDYVQTMKQLEDTVQALQGEVAKFRLES